MYRHFITSIMLTLILVAGTFFASSLVSAQSAQDGTLNQAPGDTTGGQIGGTTDDRGSFDWWWLLPLLAIPILIVMARGNTHDRRTEYHDHGIAGTKGGEARREQDHDEEVL